MASLRELSRRDLMTAGGLCLGAVAAARNLLVTAAEPPAARPLDGPFRYCLNMATIMGQKLDPAAEAEIAAQAGYSGIEPWIRNLRQYVESGKSLADLRKRIADLGLTVEGAIGFPAWAVDDPAQRAKGLEDLRSDMDLVAQIGGKRIAAPPAGINRTPNMDLLRIAERYRAALELGRATGVVPQLEIWGSSLTLSKASEAMFVAMQADHPDACVLLDMYHLYRGASGFTGLRLVCGSALHVFHINDYPVDPPRETITDAHRVFPGDGVAPLDQALRDLHETGFRGALSLELFNKDYWAQDALHVARTGLEKTRAIVARSIEEHPDAGRRGSSLR